MRKFSRGLGLCLGLVWAGSGLAQTGDVAQSRGFDPRQPCGDILRAAPDVDKMMVAAWVFGYIAAAHDNPRPVDLANNKVVLRNIIDACVEDDTRPLLALVQGHQDGGGDGPGSEADARALLERFLEPGADLAALTAALKPTEADVRAVYGEPLAGKLVAMYAQMYQPGVQIGPKPGQNAVITVRGTTDSLKRQDPVLRDFPGGYKEVLTHIVGDYPIIRFKFVTEGETLGLAFDGLIHVNGRWVLMPKPWRVLN